MAFVGLRVVYVGLYLLNLGSLRTLVWGAAVASNVARLCLRSCVGSGTGKYGRALFDE